MWWTERRRRAFETLAEKQTDLAALYAGAVQLRHVEPRPPGWQYFLAHAVRDICNRLPEILVGPRLVPRLEYRPLVGALAEATPQPLEALRDREPLHYLLPASAGARLEALIKAHQDVQLNNLNNAARLFVGHRDDRSAAAPLAALWMSFGKWFVARTHLEVGARARNDQEFLDQFDRFEKMLLSRVLDFYTSIDDLDRLLREQAEPTETTIQIVASHLAHPEHVAYLFERLDDPRWLAPLLKLGFFENPPEPIEEPSGATRFPPWAQLGYLYRIAARAPQPVAVALKSILGQKPANPNVVSTLLAVVLRLPADVAASLTSALSKAIEERRPVGPFVENRLGDVAAHLALAGRVKEALAFARRLFEPFAPNGQSEHTVSRARDVRARLSPSAYGEALAKSGPALLACSARTFFELVSDHLHTAVRSTLNENDERDHSAGWRPAIEDAGWTEDILDALVDAVRDAAIHLVDLGQDEWLFESLRRRPYAIFRRIALYVLAVRREKLAERAVAWVTRADLLFDHEVEREYGLLLGEAFADVDEADRTRLLGMALRGPELFQEIAGGEPEENRRRAELREWWMLRKLRPIVEKLPATAKSLYLQAVARSGEPEDVRARPVVGEAWVGPTSPFSSDELAALAVDDVIDRLRAWVPPRGLLDHSRAGVGRELAKAIARDPGRFIERQDRVRELAPAYVRAVTDGVREALVSDEVNVDWEKTLELAYWIVSQADEPLPEVMPWESRDPTWASCRSSVADLLVTALQKEKIPRARRPSVWRTIHVLLEDVDPTPERENLASWRHPEDHGINTIRGRAAEAAISYARWVSRDRRNAGLPPEFRDVVATRVGEETSPAVRAIFGWWFGVLHFLDPRWSETQEERLFGAHDVGVAAFGAFLRWNWPTRALFGLLAPRYRAAITQMPKRPAATDLGAKERWQRLAQHLGELTALGLIAPGGEDGLLDLFFEAAPADARHELVEFIGRRLWRVKDVPDEVTERLTRFWDHRRTTHAKTPIETVRPEETAFGWWVVAGKLDPLWLLRCLADVLRGGTIVEGGSFLLKKLANFAKKNPGEVLQALRLYLLNDESGSHIYTWREEVRTVLTACAKHEPARPAVRTIVNELGARGLHDFRDLT